MEKYLELGQIVNTKGLNGEVKVNSFAADSSRFETLNTVLVKTRKDMKEFKIDKVGYSKNQVVIKFKDIDTIEDAEKLKNAYILVDRDSLEPLPENTYYIADLIGLDVYTDDDILLGKVDDIFSTGSNDVYVVKDSLGKQKLLPAIPDVLKDIDIDNGKIIVHLIEGL